LIDAYVGHLQFYLSCLQFTRDALITISGAKDKGRNFVYFTDVKNIPNTDLATIERLWNKFSKGKFGYSVQKVRYHVCLCYDGEEKHADSNTPTWHRAVRRKNGDRARVTLKRFVERLAGRPLTEKSKGRSVGLALLSLPMT